MDKKFNDVDVSKIGEILNNEKVSLAERFRALFTLRNLGGKQSIDAIAKSFSDPSALLKHECAFCLGQMGDTRAIPALINVLEDLQQETMVRHEAGEALGAIGSSSVLNLLEKYKKDPIQEVSETCQLASQKIKWLNGLETKVSSINPYSSIDPAPPLPQETSVDNMKGILLNESESIFKRYQAMFSLRNQGGHECAIVLAEGLNCGSALFRHEIAYILGQMKEESSVPQLVKTLKNVNENEMVRHECAEALGSIATQECMEVLKDYCRDKTTVVRESCEIALDMYDFEHSQDFQYANTLQKNS